MKFLQPSLTGLFTTAEKPWLMQLRRLVRKWIGIDHNMSVS